MPILRVRVRDESAQGVNAVPVSIYTYSTTEIGAIASSASTNSDGLADFDLATGTYAVAVRAPSAAYEHASPYQVAFTEAGTYDITLAGSDVGTPQDARLCRVYEDLRSHDREVPLTTAVRFLPDYVLTDQDSMHSRAEVFLSRQGTYFYFDLVRGSTGQLLGLTDSPVSLTVPDQSTCTLTAALVAKPYSVTPASSTAAVAAEASASVDLTMVYYGGYAPASGVIPDLTVSSSDEAVATVELDQTNSQVDITGVAAGTATISFARTGGNVTTAGFRLKDLVSTDITVTVT